MTVLSNIGGWLPKPTISQPAAASASAMAAPRPTLQPVTAAVLPLRSKLGRSILYTAFLRRVRNRNSHLVAVLHLRSTSTRPGPPMRCSTRKWRRNCTALNVPRMIAGRGFWNVHGDPAETSDSLEQFAEKSKTGISKIFRMTPCGDSYQHFTPET